MTLISITKARENLPDLVNEVYFKSKTFIVTKRGIPVAKITSTQAPLYTKPKYTAAQRAKVIEEVAGMWKGKWPGKTSRQVVELLRAKGWKSHAR